MAVILSAKKAEDIQILDLSFRPGALTDYFVIATAQNALHMEALQESVQKELKEALQERPWFVEGRAASGWVLLDYVHVVCHLFDEETRQHYALEEFWGDATVLSSPVS